MAPRLKLVLEVRLALLVRSSQARLLRPLRPLRLLRLPVLWLLLVPLGRLVL